MSSTLSSVNFYLVAGVIRLGHWRRIRKAYPRCSWSASGTRSLLWLGTLGPLTNQAMFVRMFIGLLWKFLGTVQDSESMDFDRTKATTSHDGKMMIYLKLSFERTIMATSARFFGLKFGPKSDWTSRAICSGTIFAVEQLPPTTCVKLSSLQSSTWRKPSGKSGSLEVVALKHQHSKDSPLHCWLATLLHKIKVHENPIIRPERTNASVCVCVFVFVCFCVCMSALIGSDCSNSCRGRSTLNKWQCPSSSVYTTKFLNVPDFVGNKMP